MSTAPKALVILIDAAEADLIRRWSGDGRLPNIARLQAQGASFPASAMPGFGSGALWPSVAMAETPSVHGRYFNRQLPRGSYTLEKWQGFPPGRRPFWEDVAEAGRRVAVVNVPYDRPNPHFPGTKVCDWALHNPVGRATSTPASLIDEILARFQDRPGMRLGSTEDYGPSLSEQTVLLDGLIDRVAMKEEFSLDLLGSQDWDLFVTAFDECHCIGHMAWHVHDETSPFHDPAVRAELGDPVEQIYVRIDQAIGRLMEAFPTDGAVFLYVGTGMGPNYTATHMLDEILASFERTDNASRRLLLKTLKTAWHKVPVRYRGRLRKMGRRVEENIVHSERERRPYFSLPHNDISGAIRINLKGREPQGTIEPGDEYDAVCDMLEKNLLALRNLQSDTPVVKKVVRVQRDFPGPFAADMPDLFVVWNRPVPINGVKNKQGYTVRHPFTAARTGDHTEAGMMVARLPRGPVGAFEEDVSVTRLGPTVTAVVGVPLDRVAAKPVQRLVDAASAKPILEPA